MEGVMVAENITGGDGCCAGLQPLAPATPINISALS